MAATSTFQRVAHGALNLLSLLQGDPSLAGLRHSQQRYGDVAAGPCSATDDVLCRGEKSPEKPALFAAGGGGVEGLGKRLTKKRELPAGDADAGARDVSAFDSGRRDGWPLYARTSYGRGVRHGTAERFKCRAKKPKTSAWCALIAACHNHVHN